MAGGSSKEYCWGMWKKHLSLSPRGLAVLTALLFAPGVASAQSILRTAGDFTLLGGSAITNVGAGTTISNGNIGLSPTAETAITGFPPGVIVNGSIIATGTTTAQARVDLIAAQTGLANMTPTTDFTATPTLGGRTLTPGVFHFAVAADLTGALILDAQGQNNVAWVFQIGSALTTAANSSVTVINLGSNGGSDLGLFWSAGTAFNFGASNQLVGNFLAGSSITYAGLVTGSGRALALAAVSTDNTTLNAFGGPAGSNWTGGLAFAGDGTTIGLTAVPEPAAVLWITPLAALGFALWRRAARKKSAIPAATI